MINQTKENKMIRDINSENWTLSIIFKHEAYLDDIIDADFPSGFIADGFIYYWDNDNTMIARPLSIVDSYFIKENTDESE